MFLLFAILGGLIGLAVTGSASLLVWSVYTRRDRSAPAGNLTQAAPYLLRWTAFDYALLALFMIGGLLLFTDLIAVLHDSGLYPPYHVPYLLCGFVFVFAGMVMCSMRLFLTLSLVRSNGAVLPPHHHHHPSHADQPE